MNKSIDGKMIMYLWIIMQKTASTHIARLTHLCVSIHGHPCFWQWASYQIRKIAGCACAGNAGNVFPRRRFQRKPLVGDPGMHHGTCVTHVPWCMSGSLICGDGENVPGIPGACAPATLRIWQEAHGMSLVQRQITIWTNAGLLLVNHWEHISSA